MFGLCVFMFALQVTLPFFVLHGEADIVTDPAVSKALYERAGSEDKTIKLYPGMWHGLTSGEPDDNIEIVFSDIIAWLDKRCGADKAISAQPICLPGPDIRNFVPLPSSEKRNGLQKPKSKPKRSNYFCGWKGRRMHHHSAM